MTRRGLAAAVAALMLLGGVACVRGKTKAEPKSFQTEAVEVDAKMKVTVRGAETIDYQGTTKILIFRTLDKRIPLGFRLFSVGIPDPGLELRPKVKWRAAFDVLGYKGDGKYTIDKTTLTPEGPKGVKLPSGIQSNALVQVVDLGTDPAIKSYNVTLEPCVITSSHRGRVGTITCPKIRQDGPVLSLEMAWDGRDG